MLTELGLGIATENFTEKTARRLKMRMELGIGI
jgi:hypothetical protein